MMRQGVKEYSSAIKQRCFHYALQIINFLEKLPQNYIYQTLGKQLLRSATNIGANIIEAQAASSKRDFLRFYQIALKSANETKFWLAILEQKESGQTKEIKDLLKETIEISNILGASILTLKGKR